MKNTILFCSLLLLCFLNLKAQVPDLPLSFTNEEVRRFKESVEPYCVQYHDEEIKNSKHSYKKGWLYNYFLGWLDKYTLSIEPIVTGRGELAEINVLEEASRINIENGYYYISKIEAPNIQDLKIYFDNFSLSDSSYMHIYNEFNFLLSRKKIINADELNSTLIRSNPFIGNQLIIEVFEPKNNTRPNNIIVSYVIRLI
ncbi:MAG: hypothetical protein AB8H03_00435 [Saprospiraceae bacterium]